MDISAELTLQIVRVLHERVDPSRSPAFWSILPDVSRATWPEARSILSAASKPLLVAPLIEPGSFGLWTFNALDKKARSVFARERANRVEYFTEKLRLFEFGDSDIIRFEPATPAFEISARDFLQWTRDYAMSVGISIVKIPQVRVGRLIIRPPGGGAAPLGLEPSRRAEPATADSADPHQVT